MTKTPEELTAYWKAKKLETGSLWFVETDDGCRAEPMLVDIDGDLNDLEGKIYVPSLCGKHYLKILAPCDYGELQRLKAIAEKYDRIKVNGNYPDKISKPRLAGLEKL